MQYQRVTKPAQKEQPKTPSSSSRLTPLNHLGVHPLLELQRTIGNQAVLNLLRPQNTHIDASTQAFREPRFSHDFSRIPIHSTQTAAPQTKLKVNQPGDIHEQEADQVAEQVMRMAEPKTALSDDEDEAKTSLMHKQSSEPQAETGADISSIPSVVHTALNSGGGQPLDTTTRALMEPRFGHDFSQVRVHTDEQAAESARAVNALAYTVGRDVVFARDQYMPATTKGRLLLAHELAHTIQQKTSRRVSAAENTTLENNANQAALSVALHQSAKVASIDASPAIQYVKVTEGGFGRALEEFTNGNVDDKAVQLLKTSSAFMHMAKELDSNYVWHKDAWDHYKGGVPFGDDNRIKSGKFANKRTLYITWDSNGSYFSPVESDPDLPQDTIYIQHRREIPGFIADIAHEATHAARHVGASTPPPSDLESFVKTVINEEITTREKEKEVLKEIHRRLKEQDPLKDALNEQIHQVGSTVPAEVQRDLAPGIGLTYLENAFFEWRLSQLSKSENIDGPRASNIRRQVDQLKEGAVLPFIPADFNSKVPSKYASVYFNRKKAKEDWSKFETETKKLSPDEKMKQKDKLLKKHASEFFEGMISYAPN